MLRLHAFFVMILLALPGWSSTPTIGETLADLAISDRGEMMLKDDKISYQEWSYPQQPGKVHIVQYMAATMAASELNKPFTDRMKTDLEHGAFFSTTILNLDDAMWGTTGFVVSEVKSNKREHPAATLILDEDGIGREAWQLEKDSSAVIVVDQQGIVRFAKQGPMTEQEVESTLELIRSYMNSDA